jgi:uncharacterized paraquat-inducible protein A
MKKAQIRDMALLAGAVALVVFLLNAPEETTHRIPADDTHAPYYEMIRKDGKKAAEKHCEECHNAQGVPFPAGHPAKARCLLCHKIVDQ